MIRYFKTTKQYFNFINKNKEKYRFHIDILPKTIKVTCIALS